MKKWGRSSDEFLLTDERPEWAQDFKTDLTPITCLISYQYFRVLDAISRDVRQLELSRDDCVIISIKVIDDGIDCIHKAIAHIVVGEKDEKVGEIVA